MKSFVLFSTIFLLSNVALARPKTLTVISNSKNLVPTTLGFREQTTKSWLPGCSWYDILQNTGWFPATFYTDTYPVESTDQVFEFQFKKRSPLALYCAAKTDNVANGISLEIRDENDTAIAWSGISYRIGTGSQNSVEVHCKTLKSAVEGQLDSIECSEASFNSDEDLEINLFLD